MQQIADAIATDPDTVSKLFPIKYAAISPPTSSPDGIAYRPK
jgi:hypothetical protein